MIVIGIDPGKFGGIIALNEKREFLLEETMPENPMDVYHILKLFSEDHPLSLTFLEEAHPRPGNGLKATHTFAFHNGQIDMILRVLKMPYEIVPPHVWCRQMHAGTSADRPKDRSKQAAQRLFPNAPLTNPLNPKARSMHEGLMDATLIAEFGLRKLHSARNA